MATKTVTLLLLYVVGCLCIIKAEAEVYTCNFESTNLCNQWFQDKSNRRNWKRKSGSTPSDNTGPNSGYGGRGNYMYIEGSDMSTGQSARLESRSLPKGKIGIKFWRSMYGGHIGDLKVFSKIGRNLQQLGDTLNRVFNRDWLKVERDFDCPSSCKVVIQATRGKDYQSDIAIDQVSLTVSLTNIFGNSNQRLQVGESWKCNFDQNNCTQYWTQDDMDDFDWIYTHRSSPSITDRGGYILMNSTSTQPGQKCRLLSDVFTPGNMKLYFLYNMYNYEAGSLRIYTLNDDGVVTIVMEKYHPAKISTWWQEIANFTCLKPCRLVFEAVRGIYNYSDILIDNIIVDINHDIRPDVSQTRVLRDYCNFDTDVKCGWRNAPENEVKWEQWNSKSLKRNTGPDGDYTFGLGNFVLFQDSMDRVNVSGTLTSEVIRAPLWRKLQFAYYMLHFSNDSSRLNVYIKLESTGKKELIKTIQTKKEMYKWQMESLNVTSSQPYQIQIEAIRGSGGYGDVAIDNLEVNSGVLPAVLDCEFNSSFCNWKQSRNDNFDWLLNTGNMLTPGTGPQKNINYSINNYAYTDASYPRLNGDVAILESEAIGPLGNQSICVRFQYNMNGKHVGKLQLLRSDDDGKLSQVIWTRSGNQGQKWWQVYLTISLVTDDVFKLQFRSQRGFGIRGDIAIKSVTTELKSCREDFPYDCDFSQDVCAWNHASADSGTWNLASGPSNNTDVAPPADHTYGSSVGGYVYLSNSESTATIYTTVITQQTLCIRFWYFAYGSARKGKIDLWMQPKDGAMASTKWSYTGETVSWQQASVTIQSNRAYSLGFRAQANDGFKAIDDIAVTSGACA